MKKKILMVVGKFYPEISGGNLQCKKIIDTLKNEYEFKILTFTNKNINFKIDKNEYDIKRFNNKKNFFYSFVLFIKVFNFFYKEKNNFSIVHIFGISKINIPIILLSKIFNKKIIVKFSSFREDDLETIYNKSKINFLLHKYFCDKLISIAPIFIKKCKEYNVNKNKIKLIKNFLLIKKKNYKKNIIKISKNHKNVLCVGHFSIDKRNDFAFEIWKDAYLKGFKSNIIFVGNSSSHNYEVNKKIKKYILNEAKKHQLIKNVYFVEFEDQMDKIYNISDILLMTSAREGVPNALLEALYYGLNCICSKLPSIKNFLKFDNVHYIDFKSNKSIWSNELIKQLKKKRKKKINNLVSDKFNNMKIAKDYYYLYKKL